jgi:hypothetical protein
MNVLCLCPTYGRPQLVANALACFLAQDYKGGRTKLLVLDDLGQYIPTYLGGLFSWEVLSVNKRYESLPAKYNAMLVHEGIIAQAGKLPTWPGACYWDAIAVWDDDDIYLPWHLSAAVKALQNSDAGSVKPSTIWSLYRPDGAVGDGPWQESGAGRFHCSLVVRTQRILDVRGWIQTPRADFDQQQITACGPAADMIPYSPDQTPSFVYRWGTTKVQHCSSLMKSPSNTDWYTNFQPADKSESVILEPKFDQETERVYDQLIQKSAV